MRIDTRFLINNASDSTDRSTPDADEVVNRWLDRQEDTEHRAVESFSRGNEMFRAEQFGRAMRFFEWIYDLYGDLEADAKEEARSYEFETRLHELFELLGLYYLHMKEASLW